MSYPASKALVDAVLDIATGVNLRSTLQRIVDNAATLIDAKYAAIAVRVKDGEVEEFVYYGMSDAEADEIANFPEGKGLFGHMLQHPDVLRLPDMSAHHSAAGLPAGHPVMRSFLGAPLHVQGTKFGQIYLSEKLGGAEFTREDEEMVAALAAAAGVAVDNARNRELRGLLSLIEDRERIARDLHDLVIQRLFATGMSLQGFLRKYELPDEAQVKLNNAIDELDKTVKQIRQTIFALQDNAVHKSLRGRVIAEFETFRSLCTFTPELQFEGAIDAMVPERVAAHTIAVVRELLSNVAKHARATEATILVRVEGDELSVTVTDNGVGFVEPSHRRGLSNVARRAESHSGLFTIEPTASGGTRAHWSVFLPVTP
jgi:signal transduction histidine kinase